MSYDPNYRPALWASQAEASEWMTIPLPLVDIIKLSEEELPLLTGVSDLEEGSVGKRHNILQLRPCQTLQRPFAAEAETAENRAQECVSRAVAPLYAPVGKPLRTQ